MQNFAPQTRSKFTEIRNFINFAGRSFVKMPVRHDARNTTYVDKIPLTYDKFLKFFNLKFQNLFTRHRLVFHKNTFKFKVKICNFKKCKFKR